MGHHLVLVGYVWSFGGFYGHGDTPVGGLFRLDKNPPQKQEDDKKGTPLVLGTPQMVHMVEDKGNNNSQQYLKTC